MGPSGPPGPAGQAGSAAAIDYGVVMQQLLARLPPIRVQNYDRTGRLVDEESYPMGTPIKLRYGVIEGTK